MSMMYTRVYVYMYMYMYVCIYIYIYIYIYICGRGLGAGIDLRGGHHGVLLEDLLGLVLARRSTCLMAVACFV